MKKILFVAFFLSSLLTFANVPYWGKTGHRATAEIASGYLTNSAKKQIHDLLDGKSLALVSTYGDDIKSNHHYDDYKVWHYINIPKGKTYAQVKADLGPNIISAIKTCKAKLEDETTSREKKKFYLKMLIHLMGDLHQPMHIGRPDDLGGNRIIVFWFGEASNLHRVWDSDMLNAYLMSYSELAMNQEELSKKEVATLQEGTLLDWMHETHQLTKKIYASVHNGQYLSYGYSYKWLHVARKQLQIGGIRLADMLNEIFE